MRVKHTELCRLWKRLEEYESGEWSRMISINVKADIKRVSRELRKLERGLRDKATVMALNKTVAKSKTEMKRAISSEFVITQRELASKLTITKARKGHLEAVLKPFDSPSKPGARTMNLIHFLEKKVTLAEGRRRNKSGTQNELRFKIKRGGGAKTIKGAFVGNKGRTIFQRTGKSRLPIKGVTTIGVRQMFNTRRINKRVVARIRKEFPIEFRRAARRVLDRFNR